MSLIKLRTSLKDLKFEEFSGRGLYVEKNINTTEVKTGLSIIDQIDKRGDDASRLLKLFTDKPGVKFIANLGLLSLAENRKKIGQGGGVRALKNVAATLTTILGQAVVNGTGIHLSTDITTGNTYLRGVNTSLLSKEIFPHPFDESRLTTKFKDKFKDLETTIDPVIPDKTLVESPALTKDNDFDIKYKLKTGRTRVDVVNYLKVNSEELSEYNDLIDFKIVILEPGQSTPFTLVFRSYLESFDDNFNGSWNETKYIGRAESLYNYTGFSRNIGFSFKIAAASELELLPLYEKLNYLVGSTAPSYSNVFMRGVLTRVTIGDYLKNIPGFFTQISLNWNTSYPWEIKEGKNQTLNAPNVPHILDVRTSFTPIHTFTPEFKAPFITDQETLDKINNHTTLAEYIG